MSVIFAAFTVVLSGGGGGAWCLLRGGVCICWIRFCFIVSALSRHRCQFQWSSARLFLWLSKNQLPMHSCHRHQQGKKGLEIDTMFGISKTKSITCGEKNGLQD